MLTIFCLCSAYFLTAGLDVKHHKMKKNDDRAIESTALRKRPVSSENSIEKTDTITIEGVVVSVNDTIVYGIDRVDLSIDVGRKTVELSDDKYLHETLYSLNKKLKVTYTVVKTRKEVDMMVNGVTVYYDRVSVRDTSNANKVTGVLTILDYGGALPGRYSITSADGSETMILHYVDDTYQTAHDGKDVVVYYATEVVNMVADLSFLEPDEINRESKGDTILVKHQPFRAKSKYQTKLSIVKVKNDSRCPTGVQCKWAGNAEVLFKVKYPNNQASTFTLNTNERMKSGVEVNGYYYELIKLKPYPKQGKYILQTSYKAQILIEKR